ncbi:hypothetical protein, partial [Pseudomonas syringae]|uniref:hypothetical protein n=1 Tax=Pseudomonas syringae TaxID=317 RepID=UPI001F1B2B29
FSTESADFSRSRPTRGLVKSNADEWSNSCNCASFDGRALSRLETLHLNVDREQWSVWLVLTRE